MPLRSSSVTADCGLSHALTAIPSAEYGDQFAAITEELANLPAPSDDWPQLRDDTVAELSRRLTRLRPEISMTDDEYQSSEEHWRVLEGGYRRLFDAKRRFWLAWP
jgi:hypothetical protein